MSLSKLRNFCLNLIFVFLSTFFYLIVVPFPVSAQKVPEIPGCTYIGSVNHNSPNSCTNGGIWGPGGTSCSGSGPYTGQGCCQTLLSGQTQCTNNVDNLGIYNYFYCCFPSVTPTPTGHPAEKQQCNSTGTAWVTIASNVCVAASSFSLSRRDLAKLNYPKIFIDFVDKLW